jgi:hypothetical protein
VEKVKQKVLREFTNLHWGKRGIMAKLRGHGQSGYQNWHFDEKRRSAWRKSSSIIHHSC